MRAYRMLLAATLAAYCAVTGAPTVQLDPWGQDAIRVRISPNGNIVIPPEQALLPDAPAVAPELITWHTDSLGLTNGNLQACLALLQSQLSARS
jgi:hypothetical protein